MSPKPTPIAPLNRVFADSCSCSCSARALLLLLALLTAACTDPAAAPDAGSPAGRWFHSPAGIAASQRYVLVANTAHYLEGGQSRWGEGFVTIIERTTRRVVGRVESSAQNPQNVVVCGERALLLSSGETQVKGGLARATRGGAVDIIDLSAGPPFGISRSIPLGLSDKDPRIGAYGDLLPDASCATALIGSGTRADLFKVDLRAGTLLRGPDNPITLFSTPAGQNGMTLLRPWGDGVAVIDFNSEVLCLSDDRAGDLARRTCHPIKPQKSQLSGPVDLQRAPDGSALVLMTLANALYRVDVSASPFALTGKVLATGQAANRLLLHGGAGYIVNSLTSNLQRFDPATGKSQNPFAVFPTGANPYDLVITAEAEGELAWVTLFGHHEVALVDLKSGEVKGRVRQPGAADGGTPDAGAPDRGLSDGPASDGGVSPDADAAPRPDGGVSLVGVVKAEQTAYGVGAGLGQGAMPAVIQGGPQGGGSAGGSSDVLSLGQGGQIVLSFGPYDIVDGPGPDVIVFENPFLAAPYQPFAEPAVVALSAAGTAPADFKSFPCDLTVKNGDAVKKSWPYPGCAGVKPVLANVKTNTIPPNDPAQAGGDAFDLADLGLKQARYLRLTDAGLSSLGSDSRGFDLDAVVLVNYKKVR